MRTMILLFDYQFISSLQQVAGEKTAVCLLLVEYHIMESVKCMSI